MKNPTALNSPKSHGFTLAETLLSATIASTALVAALGLLSASISDNKQCYQQAAAVLLARRIVSDVEGQIARNTSASPAVDNTLHVAVYDASLNELANKSGSDASAAYATGLAQPVTGAYLASWQALDATTTTPSGVLQFKVTVESPPNVATKNRHSYTYATYVRQ